VEEGYGGGQAGGVPYGDVVIIVCFHLGETIAQRSFRVEECDPGLCSLRYVRKNTACG
jgi:hypothetical protein